MKSADLRANAAFALRSLGFPRERCDSVMATTVLLAFCGLTPAQQWIQMNPPPMTITQAMEFMRIHYGVAYAPNTRESIRFSVVRPMVELGILIANPDGDRPPQSPKYCYQLDGRVAELLRILP